MDLKWILVVHLFFPVTNQMSDHSVHLSGTCLSKKLLTNSSNASEITIDLSSKISPSCHTLSKALGISKKALQDSRVGYASKAVYIL